MARTLRDAVELCQRHPVTVFRSNERVHIAGTFGERIVKLRKEQGLNRAELARLAHIPYSTLAEIETNGKQSSKHVARLAAALGVSAKFLASGKDDSAESEAAAKAALTEEEIRLLTAFRAASRPAKREIESFVLGISKRHGGRKRSKKHPLPSVSVPSLQPKERNA